MYSATVMSRFQELCNSNKSLDVSVYKTILDSISRPDVLTIKKGTILYVSRDRVFEYDDKHGCICAAFSMDYFLYTESPVPYVPERIENVKGYIGKAVQNFYENRYYQKVQLNRDVKLMDCRDSAYDCAVLRADMLDIDGVIVADNDCPTAIALYVDDLLEISTVLATIKPADKHSYRVSKLREYGNADVLLLEAATKTVEQLA